jgi:hypothetical protein
MAHLILDVGQALALSDEQTRVGLTEVVDPNLAEPGLGEELRPDAVTEVVGVERVPGCLAHVLRRLVR